MRDVCARFKYTEPSSINTNHHFITTRSYRPFGHASLHPTSSPSSPSSTASPSREWIHHCLSQYYQELNPSQPLTNEAITHLTQRIQMDLAPYSILKLGGFSLGTIAPKILGNVLIASQTQLRLLDLGFNRITDRGATLLARALFKNQSLESLYLSGNEIGALGVSELALALAQNTTLRSLHLSGNNMGEQGAKALAKGLKENKGLRSLFIGTNGIGCDGIAAIAHALQVNQQLEELALGQNQMTNQGLEHVATAFRSGRVQLTTLEIGTNQIDAMGVTYFVQALESSFNRLENLYLDNNPIGDIGAKAIGLWMATSTNHIRVLDVSYTQLSLQGLRGLEHGISTNQSIVSLLADGHDWSSTRYLQPIQGFERVSLSVKGANTFAATCVLEAVIANPHSVLCKLTGVDLTLAVHVIPHLSLVEKEALIEQETGIGRCNERILHYIQHHRTQWKRKQVEIEIETMQETKKKRKR